VLDGAKALVAAVKAVFDHPFVQFRGQGAPLLREGRSFGSSDADSISPAARIRSSGLPSGRGVSRASGAG
jgi:hypothetical protein